MTSRRPLLGVAALVTAAVALSGCSGGGDAVPTSADPLDSPLSQYLRPVLIGIGDEQQQIADNTAIQEVIAQCMAAEGFEYIPLPYSSLSRSFPGDWRPDDEEWVAQWGYGVMQFPAYEEVQAENAAGDVNDPYYQSLSPAEQTAYSETLWGPATDFDPDRPMWEQSGCNGQGTHEVYGDNPRDAPENRAVMDAVDTFYAGQFEAPEYGELDAAWAECMADAGHPGFTRQGDARQSMSDAVEAYRFAGPGYDDPSDPEYQALRDQEIDLALVDLACREQTDYRARSLAIQYAQEEQFIADHRSELDAMIAQADADADD